jgi:hypothetical protein
MLELVAGCSMERPMTYEASFSREIGKMSRGSMSRARHKRATVSQAGDWTRPVSMFEIVVCSTPDAEARAS